MLSSSAGKRSPDAGEGVEQVRRRVAPVVQHLVEGEDVVGDAVVGEVGVFDAAEGDGSLGLGELFWRQHLHGGHLQHRHISGNKADDLPLHYFTQHLLQNQDRSSI